MSIKRGIKNGDLVYISAISTDDVLYQYGGKRPVGNYLSESEYKHTSLVGMIGKLLAYREPEVKHNKSGVTKAIVSLSLPENFFEFDEDSKPTYWNRHYKLSENKGVKTKSFDVLFATGVKLELVSVLPSDLRYGVGNTELISDYVRPTDMDKEVYSCAELDFTPISFQSE